MPRLKVVVGAAGGLELAAGLPIGGCASVMRRRLPTVTLVRCLYLACMQARATLQAQLAQTTPWQKGHVSMPSSSIAGVPQCEQGLANVGPPFWVNLDLKYHHYP